MPTIRVILTIRKQDGSIYWIERFPSMQSAEGWLAQEQTRPYWDPTYSATFEVLNADS